MAEKTYSSRIAEKFVVRLPGGLRDKVDELATQTHCSMNSVFVRAVEDYLAGQKRQQALLDALIAAVDRKESQDAA